MVDTEGLLQGGAQTNGQRTMLLSTLTRALPAYLSGEESARFLSSVMQATVQMPEQQVRGATAFLTSEICEGHRIRSHPESHQRTQVIRERILHDFPGISVVQDIPHVTKEQLQLFHTPEHVDKMLSLFEKVKHAHEANKNAGQSVVIDIDGDTSIMEGTENAAFVAAGAVCHAIDLVMDKSTPFTNAFCGVRPPGHHAEPQEAMGFCLFNNVGIGACHLLNRYPDQIKKVLILDFDVHHGNGTQAKFYNDHPQICFISTHQGHFYPGTGKVHERGSHKNIYNFPLVSRTSSERYRNLFEDHVVRAMHAFEPDFVLISAGFDAHRMDPLAEIALETEDFYWITKHVTEIAWKYAEGRIVSSLEGGYNLDALAASAAAHVRALIEGADPAVDIDQLAVTFADTVAISNDQELRVTVHYDGKDKLLVLTDRSLATLLQQCKNKFNLKKKAKTATIQDAHGTVLTDDLLRALDNDSHLYIR